MFGLARQVEVECDTEKGWSARLGGAEPPKYDDTDVTFD
jgi:hypothetical protein